MRCLYCGKELALLKRWTGSGEFCSDAHRLRYQEEYNQLALNRLLQAKPPAKPDAPQPNEAKAAKPPLAVAEPSSEVAGAPKSEPASMKVSEGKRAKPAQYESSSPAAVRETVADPKPAISARIKAPEPVPEEPAPAEMMGFIVEMPLAALAEVAPMSHPDLEFAESGAAALPNLTFEPLDVRRDTYQLEKAGLVTFEPYNRASNYTVGARERRLEVRDFVRTAPVVQIDLSPAGETGLETTSEAMDILISPQPPQGLPVLWQEPPVGFSQAGTELGDLARLSFTSTGFSGEEESRELDRNGAVGIAEPPPDVVDEIVVHDVVPDVVVDIPEPAPVEVAAEPIPEPLPETVAEAEPEPVIEQHAEQPVEQPVEQAVEQAVEPVAEQMALPELATKPLPLVLHVAAPGKGKPLQVFSSVANAVEAQVPRSTSLPLRPVMTFGPAPAAAKNEVKQEAKIDARSEPKRPTPAPVRPDPRLANVKLRAAAPEVHEDKPTVKIPITEPAAKPVAKPEISRAAKSPVKVEAKQDRKQEVKEPVKLKEEVKPAPMSPAPPAPPYQSPNELGLPQLNLQSSSGFLGQLPVIAKIGIVVVLLAAIGGLIAFSSKSGSATTIGGPGTIVAGSALPAGEAGWITDWGADPGVRRTRQISILRSSQTLTDYRIEMNGQIESKAIGWVFRAQDPKNFYVTKLEIVKPGLEPTVALVRFAIINGEEQAHAQLPLPMKVRLDTMYKIRFDALGNHFTTYVQDEKVDDWTDDHVKTGGVGFYRERGEDATLKGGMNVVPLIVRR
jgi:hypothetical protein